MAQLNTESATKLYNAVKDAGYDIGDYNEYLTKLQSDPSNADNLYKALHGAGFDIGSDYSTKLYSSTTNMFDLGKKHDVFTPSAENGYSIAPIPGQPEHSPQENNTTQNPIHNLKPIDTKRPANQKEINTIYGKVPGLTKLGLADKSINTLGVDYAMANAQFQEGENKGKQKSITDTSLESQVNVPEQSVYGKTPQLKTPTITSDDVNTDQIIALKNAETAFKISNGLTDEQFAKMQEENARIYQSQLEGKPYELYGETPATKKDILKPDAQSQLKNLDITERLKNNPKIDINNPYQTEGLSADGFVGSLIPTLFSGAYGTIGKTVGAVRNLPVMLGQSIGLNIHNTTSDFERDMASLSKHLDDMSENASGAEGGVVENFKAGNYLKGTANIASSIVKMLPEIYASASLGGVSYFAGLGASEKFDSLKDRTDIGDQSKALNAAATGAISGLTMHLALNKLPKLMPYLGKLIGEYGEKEAQTLLSNAIYSGTATALKHSGALFTPVAMAIQGMADKASANMLDYYTGVNKNSNFAEGVPQAGWNGFAMGVGFAGKHALDASIAASSVKQNLEASQTALIDIMKSKGLSENEINDAIGLLNTSTDTNRKNIVDRISSYIVKPDYTKGEFEKSSKELETTGAVINNYLNSFDKLRSLSYSFDKQQELNRIGAKQYMADNPIPEQSNYNPEQLKLEQQNQLITKATEDATNFVAAITHKESGNVIEARLRGVDQPINITKGNIVLKENGSVDIDNSDKSFYFKTPDRRLHRGYINHIEGKPSIVTAQEAIDKILQPLREQLENENTPEYSIGTKAVITDNTDPQNPANTIVTITGRDENGNYQVQRDLGGGKMQPGIVQPREILPQFAGVLDTENAAVNYIDPESGETKTGRLELDTPDKQMMFANGYATIDGKQIGFENIVGKRQAGSSKQEETISKNKNEWSKLSDKEKKQKRIDFALGYTDNPLEAGYLKFGNLLIDLDLSNKHLELLLQNKSLLEILNKLGIEKISSIESEDYFGQYVNGEIFLNNNISGLDNIRQITFTLFHELGHNEYNKLTDTQKEFIDSLDTDSGAVINYKNEQNKSGEWKTGASIGEENFADYFMYYMQGKLFNDEELLNKIPEKLREFFDNKYGKIIDNEANGLQAAEASNTQGELGQGGNGTAVEEAVNSQQSTVNSQQEEVIQQDEKGNLLFEQARPEATIQFLKDNFEKEEIIPTVEARINAINKEIARQETFKPTGNIQKDALAKQAKRQALNALNEQLAYWKDIQERVTPQNYKPQNETVSQRDVRWGEPVSLRELIIRKFIGGMKLRWDDEVSENGAVLSRGLGGEYRYGNDERKAHFNFISSTGVTPEQFAHALWQANAYEPGQFEDMPLYGMDTQDILNEILDVMNSYRSIGAMIESVDEIRDQYTEQEQAYIDSLVNDEENQKNVLETVQNEMDDATFAEIAGVIDLTEEQQQELQNLQNDVTNTRTTETVIGSDNENGSIQPGEAITGDTTTIANGTVDTGGNKPGNSGAEGVDESAVGSQQSTVSSQQSAVEGKQPWEMNEVDYVYERTKGIPRKFLTGSKYDKISEEHRQSVEKAISEGKQVPKEVLNDYPELQAQRDTEELDAYIAEQEHNTNPTEKQKETGIYPKARVSLQGHNITIETLKGTERSGIDEGGQKWSVTMQNHYGELDGTIGYDGDPIDVFIGPNPKEGNIYVVDQVKQTPNPQMGASEFDESKVMLGFDSAEEAKAAYLSNYEEGWSGFGAITPAGDNFKAWLYDGKKQRKPYADYKDTPEAVNNGQLKIDSEESSSEIAETDSKIQNIESKPKITKQAEKIDDVGEKIGGAKKDLFKEYADKIANVTDEEIARLPLSKSFPRPDFSRLIEDGKMTQETAIFLNYFYDEIPSKPQKAYRLKQWVEKVRGALDTFNSVMERTPDRDLMQEFIDKMNSNRWTQDHAFRAESYRAIKKAVNFPNGEVNTGKLSIYRGTTEKGVYYYSVKVPVGDRARLYGRYETMDEAVSKLIEMSKETAGKPKQIEFSVYSSRKTGEYFITPKGKGDIVLQGGFKTADEAFKYRTENAQALTDRYNAIKEMPDERRISNNPRIGFDYRQGKDISPEQFGSEFGFRGVEFGNWVNQEERQAHINEAYDALMDLATVIGVSPKALSLNGELGFAFGSRGGGKYAAHYETNKVVINLTKTKGAGCLAHEWFHALDNYLLRSVGNPSSYATDGPGFNKEGKPALRSELNDSFRNLMKVIRSTGFYTRSAKIDKAKGSKYWGTAVELGARGFEDFVMNKLAQSNIKNDYLVNFKSLAEFIDRTKGDISDITEKYPYPTLEESPKINKAFQNLFDTIQEGENGALFQIKPEKFDNSKTTKERFTAGKEIIDQVESLFDLPKANLVGSNDEMVTAINAVKETPELEEAAAQYELGGCYIYDEVFVNTQYQKDALELQKSWLHETTHKAVRSTIKPSELIEAVKGFSENETTLPEGYEDQNEYIQKEEMVAHAAQNLLDNHTIEDIANGNVDLSLYSESMQDVLGKVLNYITNGKFNENQSNGSRKGQLSNGLHDTGTTQSMVGNAENGNGRTELLRGTEQANRIPGTETGLSEGSIQVETLKQKQLEIIKSNNPMLDDYHTGIRTIDDIKTLQEAVDNPEWDYEEYNPDYTRKMAENAIKSGKITVYSSNKIEQGIFVSPSKMEAESYSGNGKVYSKEVNINDIAWIDPTQGQYAKVESNKLSGTITVDGIQRSTINSNGKPIHSTEEGVRNFWKWFGDSKVVDGEGRPLVVYHGTKADFNEFDKRKQLIGWIGKGFYFTENKLDAKSYGKQVINAYLKIENPFVIKTDKVNSDGTVDFAEDIPGQIKTAYKDFNAGNGDYSTILKENGHDGIIWGAMISVFEPTQIKSATGNNGEFNPNNSDIRYQIIGEKGATSLDKAEEATTRLDNLRVAKEMEGGFADKEDSRGGVYNSPEYKTADKVRQLLKLRGINKPFSVSDTHFGKSMYFTVYGENQSTPLLKVRISDHGVSNKDRIFGEQHESSKSDPVGIANDIELAIYPERYNKIKTRVIYYNKFNNQWITEPVENGKAWVKSYNNEATEKQLDNLNPEKTRIVSKEFVKESKAGNKIYKVVLENLTDVVEVPVYKYERKESAPELRQFTPQEIRLATGWEKGVDGLWRYEVPDVVLKEDAHDIKYEKEGELKLNDIVEDNELFKAYPELKNYNVEITDGGRNLGSFDTKTKTISLDFTLDPSTLIHEIQHAIQDIEGFAKGGNAESMKQSGEELISMVEDIENLIRLAEKNNVDLKTAYENTKGIWKNEQVVEHNSTKTIDEVKAVLKTVKSSTLSPLEQYRRLAGEVEARNVSARMNMSEEERGTKLLSETADVAPEDQIMIMDGLGVSNSTPTTNHQMGAKYKTTPEYYKQVQSLEELAGIGKPMHDKKGGELISDYYKRVKAWSVANNPQAWGEADRKEAEDYLSGITPDSYEAKAQAAQAAAQAAGATVVDEPKPVFQQEGHTTESVSDFARRVVVWREQRFINGIVRAEREAEAKEAELRGETPIDHETARIELDIQLRNVYDSLGNLIGKQSAKKLERWLGNKEMWADSLLPVKTFLDYLRSRGVKILDIDDYYLQATALQGKNDTGFNDYVRKYQKPVNKWIHDTIKASGFNYRDIENYVFLKHGVERNEYFKKDGKRQKADYAGVYAIAAELYAKDNGIPFDPKEKNEIGKVLKEYANANGITLNETSESGIYDELFANKKEAVEQAQVEKNRAFFDKIVTDYINNFESESNGKSRSIDDFWQKMNAANDFSLDTMADAGIITRTQADEIKSRYQYFIPLRGHEVEAEKTYEYSPDAGVFFSNPAIKAHGRITRAEHPFSYVAQMAQSAVVMKNRNDLNRTMLRLARKDKTGLFSVNKTWYIKTGSDAEGNDIWEEAELEAKPSDELNRAEWESWNERMKELEKEGRAKQFTKGVDLDGLFIKKKQKKQHAITIIENGEEYQVYINANPRISRAINGLNKSDQDRVLRFLSSVKGMIGMNVTSRNPAFMAANFSRDTIFASSILPAKEGGVYAAKYIANIPIAAKELVQYQLNPDTAPQYVREFFENGGETGFSHLWELQDMQKEVDKAVAQGMSVGKGWEALVMPIDVINKIVENTTRVAVYKTSREIGRTVERSISDAKEVSLNFNRKGAGGGITDYVRSAYLFVNASVQALNNFTKVYKEHPVKMTGVIMGYIMSGLLMSLINALAGDNDEYWNLPDYDRQNNFCIWVGNGFVKIPLPQELRVFHRMGDNIASYLWNKRPLGKAMTDTGAGLLDLIPANPSGPVTASWAEAMPDAIKPFMQLQANKSFTGAAIAKDPAFMKEGVPQWRQVRTNRANEPKAPAGIIWLSAELNAALGGDQYRSAGEFEKEVLNPDKLNHLARGYFGGVYTTATQGLGTITDRFYLGEKDLNEKTTGGNLQNAYNKIDEAEQRVNQFNRIVKDLKENKIDRVQFAKDTIGYDFGAARRIQKLGSRLRDINKTMKENQDLPEEEKKQLQEAQKTILKLVEETEMK